MGILSNPQFGGPVVVPQPPPAPPAPQPAQPAPLQMPQPAPVTQPAPQPDPAQQAFQRNSAWLKPGQHVYNTPLAPQEEQAFRQWVAANNVPFDPNAPVSDYDMRGFWKGLLSGDPNAQTAINPNDNQLHFPDYWKTPYHQSFSNESQWADPATAPMWNNKDQLVGPDGTIIFDERAQQ